MKARDARIRLELLIDRTSVELFGNDGEVALTSCFLPSADDHDLELFTTGPPARVISMEAYPLRSVWP
jgi:sucrose-6-phosphate hydrolase SacC (GH32 family)